MPLVYLKELQYGPTLKVIIVASNVEDDNNEKITETVIVDDVEDDNNEEITETIIVDDMVEVGFKFKFKGNITPILRIKLKNSNNQDTTVPIHVTFYDEYKVIFNKQIFCSSVWLEASMGERHGYDDSFRARGLDIYLYFFEIDITVQKQFPRASIPNINKLYEDTEFADFQLHAADGNVPMHKAYLAANSDVFKAMVKGEWKEKGEGQINIEGVTVKTLQHLKDYMYLGMLPDEDPELKSLLVVAARYLMDNLKADCSKKLIQTVKPESVDGLIKFACQYDIPELMQALLLNIPDKLVTKYYEYQNKQKESTDDGDNK
ncbi:uncharacterized protein LOC125241363 [Leguminivora glycinivorella]|uniref:uncharacterized protein LOC125241363 n=1 Tax=Leguminivora glycinivorella TaxID=1035111 RepID=UPI00200D614B|nr:uncharacterized protein LOC125241363 [Leguminivora glycinivorella]